MLYGVYVCCVLYGWYVLYGSCVCFYVCYCVVCVLCVVWCLWFSSEAQEAEAQEAEAQEGFQFVMEDCRKTNKTKCGQHMEINSCWNALKHL